MNHIKYLFAVCCFISFSTAGTEAQTAKLGTWDVFEISLKVPLQTRNPYVDCLKEGQKPYISARFVGISGDARDKTIEVPGFWYGGDTWKIRFTPPHSGTWKYQTLSADRGIKQKKGEITVHGWTEDEKKANPRLRGFIRVNNTEPRSGRYFEYSDGTPFLWIGDTWWNWTHRNLTFESFKMLADTRSAQGFNVGQLFFAGNGWSPESSLLDSTFTHPDIEQIEKVERMIAYANSIGITIWIHAWWCRENMDKTIGKENINRWWRYVIHRLHAYNVIWVIAGEYNMNNYGGFPVEFWNDLGKLIKSEDPYAHIVGAHPTPPMWEGGADAPQWSTAEAIHNQAWLDYNQSQCGHARWCNEFIPEIIKTAYAKEPAKPVVVTEPWYEFVEGNPTAMDIRFGAWSAIMSGAAGHSYGGGHVWKAHTAENRTGIDAWPIDTSVKTNTLIYPGAVSVGFAGKYLRNLNWWKLEPHPELAGENPSHYCLADPGREYLFYLRYGGSVKIDLTKFPSSQMFRYVWTDLVNNRDSRQGTLSGGKINEVKCPEDYPGTLMFKDWILHIQTTAETTPDTNAKTGNSATQPGDHGKVHHTGRIILKSNDVVYIESGAVVKGSLFLDSIKNVRISGHGILDGACVYEKGQERMVEINRCENILVEGILINDSKHWTAPCNKSSNITYRNLKVISGNDWDDGIDIVSSQHVLVDGCFIRTKDDCIAIKAGITYY